MWSVTLTAQDKTFNLYSPVANASEQITLAVDKASESGKHILLQIGGNWCKWCRMFHQFSKTTPVVDSLLNADYIVIHINHSKENKNEEILKELEFPQRFGFPVFVVLDGQGSRIHTQNSAYLEEGEGYSEK
jgi:thiol:disulfide interchange protein